MSKLPEFSKPIIDPIYSQSAPSDPISLGTVNVQLMTDGEPYSADAEMRFIPQQRLSFTIRDSGNSPLIGMQPFLDGTWDGTLTLPDRGVSFDAFWSSITEEGVVLTPGKSGVTVTSPVDTITRATFHLFNFPKFHGPDDYSLVRGTPPKQGFTRCGCLDLNADGWVVRIAATDRTEESVGALKKNGGYIITHVGAIAREDGAEFSSQDLDEVLTCIRYFLSFALGRWAGVGLPVGFDSDDSIVYEQWGLGFSADNAWHGTTSWFDEQHAELLSQVFPGFRKLWGSELWHRPLTSSLYWYLGALNGGTRVALDAGLIQSQTALELLAWNYCVLDRKMISRDAFRPRGLSAADKLRLHASAIGLTLDIPSSLPGLANPPGRQWLDSFDAITRIRNSLVHPDSDMQLTDDAYYDAWRLSLWYLDLVLLHLCGHTGTYANRLLRRYTGEVESVPWSSS